MTKEVLEKRQTIDDVRANLETQLKAIDTKVERATSKVDRLMIERNRVSALLERVNRVKVDE